MKHLWILISLSAVGSASNNIYIREAQSKLGAPASNILLVHQLSRRWPSPMMRAQSQQGPTTRSSGQSSESSRGDKDRSPTHGMQRAQNIPAGAQRTQNLPIPDASVMGVVVGPVLMTGKKSGQDEKYVNMLPGRSGVFGSEHAKETNIKVQSGRDGQTTMYVRGQKSAKVTIDTMAGGTGVKNLVDGPTASRIVHTGSVEHQEAVADRPGQRVSASGQLTGAGTITGHAVNHR